ncbi:RING-H2 finger protein ATL72-like [Phalaenopsis equestris]|uniref:RING-H2 finger protein ATL72-like n=1 Tax=Phalaenopsis equestris TaxID=78828 RepID=UPI0009E5C8B3|nr:RING-H2 finger protein ATL72-like [Phalaenopsis equestris]
MAISSHRSLLQAAVTPIKTAATTANSARFSTNFDTNLIMMVVVLFCALICALGLNSFVRCALRLLDRHDIPIQILLARTAARRSAIRKLPVVVYSAGLKLGSTSLECAICLAEIGPGERIRQLPKCGHGFHVLCVDKWLLARPTCPTCRQCLFSANQKSDSCVGREQEDRISIEPLEPEGLVTDFRI